MSGEKLTINKDGLVTSIGTVDDDYIVDASYDYNTPYTSPSYSITTITGPTLSATEDISLQNSNVFSMNHDITGKMTITGEDADIEIDGVSLKETLATMQERLAILQPNPKLEKEFAVLREIRMKYIQLEKELLEKKQMWDTLNRDD